MEAMDNLISQELLKLSYHDRNAINEEIHGVRCLAVEETPELLRMSLNAFQSHLDRMPLSEKQVYTEIVRLKRARELVDSTAMSIDQGSQSTQWREPPKPDGPPYSFVDDEAFRLRFLRCELFDVQKAALRFVKYLKVSYELFGAVALTRVVRISDFSRSELRLIRKGFYQILPYRDRAGRRVVVLLGGMSSDVDYIERAKCFFYIRDVATRDSVESQRKGVVHVGDVSTWMDRDAKGTLQRTSSFSIQPQTYALTKNVIQCVPTRMVAVHTCWPDTAGSRLFNMINLLRQGTTGSTYAARVRTQIGTEIETRYKLRGYGIPIHLMPLTKTGAIKLKYFNEWLRIQKILEEASEEEYSAEDNALTRVVVCPGLNDVVFRQGTPSMKNPGNVNFRDTMIAHLEDHHNQHKYLEGHQQQPGQIEMFCNWLIENTENTKGGQFLEWDKRLNVWVKMIDRQKIKSKVAIAYRDSTKRFLNRQQKMNSRTASPSDPTGGSYAFVEGGKGREEYCKSSERYTSETIDGVPLRSDSNYNETSCWF